MLELINILKAIIFGFATGLVISVPLGPAGIESVKRTISRGYRVGFVVSLGAIGADMAYLLLINAGLSNLLAANKRTEALFWIVAGIILTIIGYVSYKSKKGHKNSALNFFKNGSLGSMPFLTGFLITFTNPMTPSLWLTLSGTVIRAWYYVDLFSYYTFIFSILAGMITWFALLNYFALKGKQILKPSSDKVSFLFEYINLIIGIGFIIFGLFRLVI